MKRIFIAAMVTATICSCATNEVTATYAKSDNPDAIGLELASALSRASVDTDAATLEDATLEDGTVVLSYKDSAETPVSSSLSFIYTGSEWTEENSTAWSSITLPATFFSAFDNATVDATDGAISSYVVAADAADQLDLVYFASTLITQPTDSKIAATFKHALSKAVITALASKTEGLDLFISKVCIDGIDLTGDATISLDENYVSSIAWDVDDSADEEITYYVDANVETTGAIEASTTTTAIAGDNMYFIPQSLKATSSTTGTGDEEKTTYSGSFVTVVYRSSIGGVDVQGYAVASTWVEKYNINTDEYSADWNPTAPLYVAVKFPLTYEFLAGTSYSLDLDFDGSNIYYDEGAFVDEDGDPIEDTKGEPGTPEGDENPNPDNEDVIGLTVSVQAWGDVVAKELGNDVPVAAE